MAKESLVTKGVTDHPTLQTEPTEKTILSPTKPSVHSSLKTQPPGPLLNTLLAALSIKAIEEL